MRHFLLNSCLVGSVLFSANAKAADDFDIPVILPLTGGAAFLGKAEQDAIQRYEKVANAAGGIHGKMVRFNFSDDQSSPQIAVQLFNEAKRSSSPVIFGSALASLCNAMIPLARRGPVLYCFSPLIDPPKDGFVFSAGASGHTLVEATFRYFQRRGFRKIAFITSSDASGQDAQKQLKELLATEEFKDIDIVENSQFNPTDVSVSAQMQRIKGKAPDVLVTWASGAPIGTVFRGIRDAGLDIPVSTPNSNMTYAQMAQYADFLPRELYVATTPWLRTDQPETPSLSTAKEVFFEAYKGAAIKPDGPSTFAWDPVVITVQALRKLEDGVSADDLRKYLSTLHDFDGINGSYDFSRSPSRGLDTENTIVSRWDRASSTWIPVSGPLSAKPK
jgi:branched-chain amino acid transport system substrate-binding protein